MSDWLAIEPLTKAAFAPFGEVIERDGAELRSINQGTTDRLHALAALDVDADGGHPIVSIFRGRVRPFPIEIAMLERHPLGSQAFYPLQPFDWLVVVGGPEANATSAAMRCFRATGTQGVNYHRDVWHHPLLVLQPVQEFLVVDRAGPGDNLEEIAFGRTIARIAV